MVGERVVCVTEDFSCGTSTAQSSSRSSCQREPDRLENRAVRESPTNRLTKCAFGQPIIAEKTGENQASFVDRDNLSVRPGSHDEPHGFLLDKSLWPEAAPVPGSEFISIRSILPRHAHFNNHVVPRAASNAHTKHMYDRSPHSLNYHTNKL